VTIRRGETWWADLDPTRGSEIPKTRPCVILTHDVVNQRRHTLVVVPLSTAHAVHPPISVAAKCGGKMAVAVVDQVRAIAKERLRNRIGVLSEQEMEAIGNALRQVLDLA
jgi:mRNA interferase MazF